MRNSSTSSESVRRRSHRRLPLAPSSARMTSRGLGMYVTPSLDERRSPLETRVECSRPDHPQVIRVVAIDFDPADCSPSRRVQYLPPPGEPRDDGDPWEFGAYTTTGEWRFFGHYGWTGTRSSPVPRTIGQPPARIGFDFQGGSATARSRSQTVPTRSASQTLSTRDGPP